MAKFLDDVGLGRVWSIIKSAINQLVSDILKKLNVILKVTYLELVDLRYNGELIPGQQYLITDYFATASADDIRTEKHRFDIIVTATSTISVSEDAKACLNDSDGYFDDCNLSAWEIKYCLDNDTNRFQWAGTREGDFTEWIEAEYSIATDLDDENEVEGSHNSCDLFKWWGYNADGILCIYKSDDSSAEYKYEIDVTDEYQYRGVTQYKGNEYDVWQKYENGSSNIDNGYDGHEFILTKRIVTNNSIDPKFTEGRGVIYYMKDEHNNECSYDFKNFLFARYPEWFNANEQFVKTYFDELPYCIVYFYTFSHWDGSFADPSVVHLPKDLTVMSNINRGSVNVSGNKIICDNSGLTLVGMPSPNNVFIYPSKYYLDDSYPEISCNTLINSTNVTFLGTTIVFNNIITSENVILGELSTSNDFRLGSDLHFVFSQGSKIYNCCSIHNTGVNMLTNYFHCNNIHPAVPNEEMLIISSTFTSVENFLYDTNIIYSAVKPGDYDSYSLPSCGRGSTIALKSNGKIVVYNEADLIADLY